MPEKALIEKLAALTGFERGVLEKVLVLTSILRALNHHETIKNWWLLKGGTALNLLYLDLPRLSVDIDLNFIGVSSVKDLPKARQTFEAALSAICERERCSVKRVPTSHAGGKFRLRFDSAFGSAQNLEVDVNYVSRVPLYGILSKETNFPPIDNIREKLFVPTLSFEELAAGKFAALVSRFAARDAFDAASILTKEPLLLKAKDFRIAFICNVASGRADIRTIKTGTFKLDKREIKEKLEPLLQGHSEVVNKRKDIAHDIEKIISGAIERLIDFSNKEKAFLDSFLDTGEIKSELLTNDAKLQHRIKQQPMLLWKQKHVVAQLTK